MLLIVSGIVKPTMYPEIAKKKKSHPRFRCYVCDFVYSLESSVVIMPGA